MIKKAILPVAGMGTRFLPVTKASPKEMLPIIDKPVIQYIVEEAVNSGINEIIFVTGKGKRSIEDYFDNDPELIKMIKNKKKDNEYKELKKLENLAKIIYVRQSEPLGDGHAILCAEHIFSKNEDFAVLYGDDIIVSKEPALKQLLNVYEKSKTPVIGVQKIKGEEIENYGVIDIDFKKTDIKNSILYIKNLIEKPKYKDAPSNYGIIGKYICTYDIFQSIKKGEKSKDRELRLIDGFRYYLKKNEIYACVIKGKRYDTGSKIGWLKANIAFAKERGII